MTPLSPFGAMLDDPVGQSSLKANIIASFLGFDPFVFQDLFTFGLKFAVKTGVAEQVFPVRDGIRVCGHNRGYRRL